MGRQILKQVLFVFLTQNLLAQTTGSVETTTKDPFSPLQAQYFPMLDFTAGPEHLRAIPLFAGQLNRLADQERERLGHGVVTSDQDKQRAGLIFIYDALMTINNVAGVKSGVLSFEELVSGHRFAAPSLDPNSELVARMEFAVQELQLAATLRPDDRRIDSWVAAAQNGAEITRTQTSSPDILENSIQAIAVRPSFNLWSAIILFKDQDESSPLFIELAANAKNFVDGFKKGESPCQKNPQDCANGVKAPYNFQTATVELGDVFLRRAEFLLSIGDRARAMEMLGYAQGTYGQLTAPAQAQTTSSWPDHQILQARLDELSGLKSGQTVTAGRFQKSPAYKTAYDCASCHGRAPQGGEGHLNTNELIWSQGLKKAMRAHETFLSWLSPH